MSRDPRPEPAEPNPEAQSSEAPDAGFPDAVFSDAESSGAEEQNSAQRPERCWLRTLNPIESLADWLADRSTRRGLLDDLKNTIVVLPGRRAGRRLEDLLSERSADAGRVLVPPRTMTISTLFDELASRQLGPRTASRTELRLAWSAALADAETRSSDDLEQLFPRHEEWSRSDRDDLARRLQQIDTDLRWSGRLAGDLFTETNDPRWHVFEKLQRSTRSILSRASRRAATLDPSTAFDGSGFDHVVLAGIVDLPRVFPRFLSSIPWTTTVASIEVSLNETEDERRLDEWGRIALGTLAPPISAERILHTHGVAEQCEWAIELSGRATGTVTIGVCDESLTSGIVRHGDRRGIRVHDSRGRTLDRMATGQLIELLANWVESRDAQAFASLIRLPGVLESLALRDPNHVDRTLSRSALLRSFARMQRAVLPGTTDDFDTVQIDESNLAGHRDRVLVLLAALRDRVRPLDSEERPRAEWASRIGHVLSQFGSDKPRTKSPLTLVARQKEYEAIRDLLEAWTALPAASELDRPLSIGAALREFLSEAREITLPIDDLTSDVDAVGFLELPWDDAESLVVVGAHEGSLPSKASIDPLLPDSIRQGLGLPCVQRRIARDAYLTSVIAVRVTAFVLGTRTGSDESALPSRFLLRGTDPFDTAHRWQRWADPAARLRVRGLRDFGPRDSGPRVSESGVPRREETTAGHSESPWTPEPPTVPLNLRRLSVSRFRRYLECPYRFYLEQLLSTDEWTEVSELDAGQFGTIAHDILEQFVRNHGDLDDGPLLQAALDTRIDALLETRFGSSVLSSVPLQLEQLRARLHGFVDFQRRSVEEGWRTVEIERSFERIFDIDGEPFVVKGRIDRIDEHPDLGHRVIDYKTGDRIANPDKHRTRDGEWVDLQLPLYHWLCRGNGYDGPLQVGYVPIPKQFGPLHFVSPPWTDADYEEADAVAQGVAKSIIEEKFWPPAETPPPFDDRLSPILHDEVRRLLSDAALDSDETETHPR